MSDMPMEQSDYQWREEKRQWEAQRDQLLADQKMAEAVMVGMQKQLHETNAVNGQLSRGMIAMQNSYHGAMITGQVLGGMLANGGWTHGTPVPGQVEDAVTYAAEIMKQWTARLEVERARYQEAERIRKEEAQKDDGPKLEVFQPDEGNNPPSNN